MVFYLHINLSCILSYFLKVMWWVNFIILHVDTQFSQYHLLKRDYSFPHVFLELFKEINWPYMFGSTSGFSTCVFLCQKHNVSNTRTVYYNLKSGRVITLVLVLVLKTALTIQSLLWFHTHFRFFFFSPNTIKKKNYIESG